MLFYLYLFVFRRFYYKMLKLKIGSEPPSGLLVFCIINKRLANDPTNLLEQKLFEGFVVEGTDKWTPYRL